MLCHTLDWSQKTPNKLPPQTQNRIQQGNYGQQKGRGFPGHTAGTGGIHTTPSPTQKMLPVAEQDEKCRACCYLGYATSKFSSVKEVLLWGGLRLWLPLMEKKPQICKSEDLQLQGYCKETVLEVQRAPGREGLLGAEEQRGGIHEDPRALHAASASGHTTGTRASVPAPAPRASARKASQGKLRRNHHLPHFPLFQEPVTLQRGDFHSPRGHLGTQA